MLARPALPALPVTATCDRDAAVLLARAALPALPVTATCDRDAAILLPGADARSTAAQGGNLGLPGMQNFFDSHSCGATCAALGLGPVSGSKPGSSASGDSGEASLSQYFMDDWHIVEE